MRLDTSVRVQAAYAQFQKDMPATAIASGELDNHVPGIGSGDASEFSMQTRHEAVVRLGRGYALGTLILISIVITAAVVSHQSLTSFSSDVALTKDAVALLTYAADALLALRALQVMSSVSLLSDASAAHHESCLRRCLASRRSRLCSGSRHWMRRGRPCASCPRNGSLPWRACFWECRTLL